MYGIIGVAAGALAGLFAYKMGATGWQLTAVIVAVAVGIPTLLTGRLNNW